MKRNGRAQRALHAASLAAAFCLLGIAAPAALAQQTGPPPVGLRDPFAEVRERQQREAQLRGAEIMAGAKPVGGGREAELAAERMREDFREIQVLRNKVVRRLKSSEALDYRAVADETEEINKRAGRLKAVFVKETPGEEKKAPEKEPEMTEAELTEALVRMCHRIDSFTESPLFKQPAVVDVQQSAKVERDLREIVRLSAAANRSAAHLRKARGK